jgi:hypothetical protein
MVRAILDGRKTQTRRVINPQPYYDTNPAGHNILIWKCGGSARTSQEISGYCPYGQPGDRLWVRETWEYFEDANSVEHTIYKADNPDYSGKWRPSIFMPRWASRITLEIVNVRVERVQDISEGDARAEGFPITWDGKPYDPPSPEIDRWQGYGGASFCLKWNSINAKRGYGWDVNPWVWVVEFKRIEE